MLCGCAGGNLKPAPAPLAVDLSALRTCEQLLVPPALPAITAQTDARVAFVRDEAALLTAIDELATGGACVKRVRESYSGK